MGIESLYDNWINDIQPSIYENIQAPDVPVYSNFRSVYLLYRTEDQGSVEIYRFAKEVTDCDGYSSFELLPGAKIFMAEKGLDASVIWKHIAELQRNVFAEEKSQAAESFKKENLLPALRDQNPEAPITPNYENGYSTRTKERQRLNFIVRPCHPDSTAFDLSVRIICEIDDKGALYDAPYDFGDRENTKEQVSVFVKNCFALAPSMPAAYEQS